MENANEPEITMASCRLTEAEVAAVVAVLSTGGLRQGPMTERLENLFCENFGARHAIACASGTAALHLAYLSLLEPGTEVLLPALTFLATASMVVAAGATPVLCDVNPDTLLIDLEDASRRMTSRTSAIVPVHLFGNCCNRAEIEQFARQHQIKVIWDAAQAHGASWNGQNVATWSTVCFSLYATKNLFAGEGGMICTDDSLLCERLRLLRSHGQDATGRWRHLGFNYRMSDIHAAIAVAQMDRFDEMSSQRRANAERLRFGLGGIPGVRFQTQVPGTVNAWHRFAILVDPVDFSMSRDALAAHLSSRGIQTSTYYGQGLHQEPYVQEQLGLCSPCPSAQAAAATLLCLPNHHDMRTADVDRVVAAVRDLSGC